MIILLFILIISCECMRCPLNEDMSDPFYFNILIKYPYICKYTMFDNNKQINTLKLFNNKQDTYFYRNCYTVSFNYKCIHYTRILYPNKEYYIFRECLFILEYFKSEYIKRKDNIVVSYPLCNLKIFGEKYTIRNIKTNHELLIKNNFKFNKILSIEIYALYLICNDLEGGIFEFKSIIQKYINNNDYECRLAKESYYNMYGLETIYGSINKKLDISYPRFNLNITKL